MAALAGLGWVTALSLRAGEEGGDEGVWGASVLHPAPDIQEEMGWEIQGFMAELHPQIASTINTWSRVGLAPHLNGEGSRWRGTTV